MYIDLEINKKIESLKFNLLENKYPFFNDNELKMLLELNKSDILLASYKGCLMKAQADDSIKLGPIATESNREFWLELAKEYKEEYEKSLIDLNSNANSYYKIRMNRVDEQ